MLIKKWILKRKMIVILDYGMGNSASILNMLRKAGGDAIITADLDAIKSASAIIMPGVGAFDNGMIKLNSLGLSSLLTQRVVEEKIPFIGICLGMQLLFDRSDEGNLAGLGWLRGNVKHFDFSALDDEDRKRLKVPHMGWNVVNPIKFETLFASLEKEARFYFVHSYYVKCSDSKDILATTFYGKEFTCSVRKNNIWGVQFHPEKSHRFGLQFFRNFLKEI
jgi:imidazole glycerol-phosphate synthase subunit HisH